MIMIHSANEENREQSQPASIGTLDSSSNTVVSQPLPKVGKKFPRVSRRNSFINDSCDWDFFDNNDNGIADKGPFLPVHQEKEKEAAEVEIKQMSKEKNKQLQELTQDGKDKPVDLSSGELRQNLIESALDVVFSPQQEKAENFKAPSGSRSRRVQQRSINDMITSSSASTSSSTRSIISSSSQSIVSSSHSRRSSSGHSRKNNSAKQVSRLIASRLRAQEKHERSKRPGGARGRRRAVNSILKPARSSSLQRDESDNADISESSFGTTKAHSTYTSV